jgi:hypothetical protein
VPLVAQVGAAPDLIPPEISEPIRRKLRIAYRVLDVPAPYPGPDGSSVVASVRQHIAAAMAQHLRINWEGHTGDGRYCRAVFAVPFKRKAKAVLPSSDTIDVDGLLPDVKSNPPTVSPAINTPTMASINMPFRWGAG